MRYYCPLRTKEDLRDLRKACGHFRDIRAVTMMLSPGRTGNTLTLFLVGSDLVPVVEIVFRDVMFCKLDNDPITGLDFAAKSGTCCVRFRHTHSFKQQIDTKSRILARKIEWRAIKKP